MKINSFHATNVHGYLNFDINFFSDLTFLIGINGSGKTSALKLLLGLTSPSFQYLSKIKYSSCKVVCSTNNDEKDIVITAESIDDNHFQLSVQQNNELFVTGSIERYLPDSILSIAYETEDLSIREAHSREMFETSEIIKKIQQLATPKYLGLDRRVYEGRFIDRRYIGYNSKYKKRHGEYFSEISAIDYSLEEVQTMVYDYTRKIAEKQPEISEDFKQKIFRQSFSYPEQKGFESIPKSIESISEKKEAVLTAINNLGMSYLNSDIVNYYKKIEELVAKNIALDKKNEVKYRLKKTSKKDDIDPFSSEYISILSQWINNSSQLKRIDEIINYSQAYQERIAELRAPIRRLENIVTNFLTEGKKNLFIEPDGRIKVGLKNGTSTSVYELSSGEKQIIIMIAHLIFEEDQKPSGIFIIDEPELSLHIAWQQIFVDSITEASPKTQFILATHAPSIISKVERELLCQDLNNKNN